MLNQQLLDYSVIAIPSFERYQSIKTKTLSTLYRTGINANKIFIFVANEFEKGLYEHELIEYKHLYNDIIVGVKGIRNQRIFISKFFREGQYVISCDDDIEEFYIKKGNDKYIMTNMNEFFEYAFKELKLNNAYLWGMYPTPNTFWMKENDMTNDLRYAIGVCHGYINRHLDCLYSNPLSEGKEDYETSILYYINDGIILRFNNISFKTKFNAIGGLGKFRFEMNKKNSEYLCTAYPDLCTPKTRKNGMCEIRLKTKIDRKIDFDPDVLPLKIKKVKLVECDNPKCEEDNCMKSIDEEL